MYPAPALESTASTVESEPSTRESVTRKKKPLLTSRGLWLVAYGLTAVLLVVRAVSLRAHVGQELRRSDLLDQVKDERLRALAINTGFWLAILISLLIMWIYYSLASVMERNLFRAVRSVNDRLHFGLFFLVALMTSLPVQAFSAALQVTAPKQNVFFYLYVAIVGLTCPLLFRGTWQRLPRSKVFLIFLFSVILAGLSIAA